MINEEDLRNIGFMDSVIDTLIYNLGVDGLHGIEFSDNKFSLILKHGRRKLPRVRGIKDVQVLISLLELEEPTYFDDMRPIFSPTRWLCTQCGCSIQAISHFEWWQCGSSGGHRLVEVVGESKHLYRPKVGV